MLPVEPFEFRARSYKPEKGAATKYGRINWVFDVRFAAVHNSEFFKRRGGLAAIDDAGELK